jgi:hypothetical protein
VKHMIAAGFVALFVAALQDTPAHSPHPAQASLTQAARQPVLVELFTSEGCSSCPPADALLSRLEREQPVQGAEVIAIEEHVDYWNQQGWVDPFSSAEWTQRQQEYVARFKENGPYTPEMVVDGQSEFVGSRERQAREAIQRAAQQAKAEITLTARKASEDSTQGVDLRIDKVGDLNSGAAVIWLAVTEKNLESAVKAGENAGRDLRHASVLRLLRKVGTVDAKSSPFATTQQLKLKSNWSRDNLKIVAFAQDTRSWRILGVSAINFAK